MKKFLRQLIISVLFLTSTWWTIGTINTARANSYLVSVTVTVTTIAHSDSSTTSYVSDVEKMYDYHSSQGSHQHESPEVEVYYDSSLCYECYPDEG